MKYSKTVYMLGLLAAPLILPVMLPATAQAQAQVGVAVTITEAPPPIPVYEQPPLPGADYIWEPGYWHWGAYGWYWVPGTWVLPPQPGLLWTPGYWGFVNGAYLFHHGYWGPHVGFYGGVNYGFGYGGHGYDGGHWQGNHFFYNQAYNHIDENVHVTNVYNRPIEHDHDGGHGGPGEGPHPAFNGQGGVTQRATPQERTFSRHQAFGPTPEQLQHRQGAANEESFRASVNHGQPSPGGVPRPGQFHPAAAPQGGGHPPEGHPEGGGHGAEGHPEGGGGHDEHH